MSRKKSRKKSCHKSHETSGVVLEPSPQPASSQRVELKYCEACGCLLTRPLGSGLSFCSPCEEKQSKATMYLVRPRRRGSHPPRMNKGIDLQACAEMSPAPSLEVCA